MADVSEITHPTPPLIHGDPEAPPLSPQSEPSWSTLLHFTNLLLWLVCEIRWHLLFGATILYGYLKAVVFVAITATKWLAHMARRHLFISAIILYGILIGLVAGVTKRYYNKDIRFGTQDIPDNPNGTALIGHAYRIDLISQTLSISWELAGCGDYLLPTYPPIYGYECDCIDRAVDIYVNGASEPTFSYDPSNLPIRRPGEPRYVNILNTFDMEHPIDVLAPDRVPFDSYYITALVFMIDRATNESMPIISFAAGEGPNGFIVSSTNEWVWSSYTYDSGTGPKTVDVPSTIAFITIKRSRLARAFTMCLLLVDSGLAVGSTYVMLLVFFKRDGLDSTVLLLPVTIVLTIPTLRGLYPGSPPFGIYLDTFGLFLQMMTVAMCSMILLHEVARPSAKSRKFLYDIVKAYS